MDVNACVVLNPCQYNRTNQRLVGIFHYEWTPAVKRWEQVQAFGFSEDAGNVSSFIPSSSDCIYTLFFPVLFSHYTINEFKMLFQKLQMEISNEY